MMYTWNLYNVINQFYCSKNDTVLTEKNNIVDNEKIDIGTRARPLAIDLGLQQLGKQSNKWEQYRYDIVSTFNQKQTAKRDKKTGYWGGGEKRKREQEDKRKLMLKWQWKYREKKKIEIKETTKKKLIFLGLNRFH